MTRYLVKLKPLDIFFFGQENKYRRKQKEDKNGKAIKDKNGKLIYETQADYFQQSSYFPQQTALFGTLRYCLLEKNGQIPIKSKTAASELIGKKSFQAQKKEQDFGFIQNISAAFLLEEKREQKTCYFQNPKDLILEKEKKFENLSDEEKDKLDFSEKMKIEFLQISKHDAKIETNLGNNIPFFSNYNEKAGLDSFLYSNKEQYLPFDFDKEKAKDGVFIKQEKIGIHKKDRNVNNNKEGLYKQIVYKLQEGFSFAFFAEIKDEEKDLDGYTSYVSMGADKSAFKISFEKTELELENEIHLEKNEDIKKIVLLSDAYLSDYNSKDDSQFAISSTKDFRFLKTVVQENDKKYYSSDPIKGKSGDMIRSDKLNLIEKGSVFFFKDETQKEAFAKKLKSEANFYQIGYNNFID